MGGTDLDRLDEYPGTGAVPDETLFFVVNPAMPKKGWRLPARRLPKGGDSAPYTLTPNVEVGGVVPGVEITGTSQDILTKMLEKYLAPAITSLTFRGLPSPQMLEIGTLVPGGPTAFGWTISQSQNVAASSLSVQDMVTGVVLASGLANDGGESVSITGFTAVAGESRRFRLAGLTTEATPFSADAVVGGAYSLFFGPAAAAPTTSAAVRALPGSALTSEGQVFTLLTGTSQQVFALALPPGKALRSVVDLDALNADITGQYTPTVFNVADAGGQPVAYTVHVMRQAVPYSSNHRHQFTIS